MAVMCEALDSLPSLGDLLLPEDFEQTLADFDQSEDVLFGPSSLLLFERPPTTKNHAVAPLPFTETASNPEDAPRSGPAEEAARPQRQRLSSSASAAIKHERKLELNRCDAPGLRGRMQSARMVTGDRSPRS